MIIIKILIILWLDENESHNVIEITCKIKDLNYYQCPARFVFLYSYLSTALTIYHRGYRGFFVQWIEVNVEFHMTKFCLILSHTNMSLLYYISFSTKFKDHCPNASEIF